MRDAWMSEFRIRIAPWKLFCKRVKEVAIVSAGLENSVEDVTERLENLLLGGDVTKSNLGEQSASTEPRRVSAVEILQKAD